MQLKKNCIHPTTQAPYILSLKGGKDNSHENLQVMSALCYHVVLAHILT